METQTTITAVETHSGAITLCAGDVFAVSECQPCEDGYLLMVEVADGG